MDIMDRYSTFVLFAIIMLVIKIFCVIYVYIHDAPHLF